jgi:hypothetical protein
VRFSAVLITAVVAGVVVTGQGAGAEPVIASADAVGSLYTPLPATRVLDTRGGSGPVGPGGVVTLNLADRLPATTTAVVFNLTGTEPTAATHVTAYPNGLDRPTASNLNLRANETRANLVTVAVGANRAVDLYNNAGSTHLVADLAGYYSTDAGSRFLPVDPQRLLLRTHVGPGSTTAVDLPTYAPASTIAVVVTLTAADATHDTYVTAWPAGHPRPGTSTVNVPAGGTNPNLATVAVGPDRRVNLYNHHGDVDLIVDLAGYYTSESGGVFTPVAPVRVFDTRDGTGTFEGTVGPIAPSTNVAFRPGAHVPDEAIGMVFNLTGTAPTATTYVTAWRLTNIYGPYTSNLNLSAGQTSSNLTVIPALQENRSTRAYIYNNAGDTHVTADLAGYFWVP